MLRFVGNGDQKEFTKSPQHFHCKIPRQIRRTSLECGQRKKMSMVPCTRKKKNKRLRGVPPRTKTQKMRRPKHKKMWEMRLPGLWPENEEVFETDIPVTSGDGSDNPVPRGQWIENIQDLSPGLTCSSEKKAFKQD